MVREIKGYIHNEDPSTHWSFLPIEGETILDLEYQGVLHAHKRNVVVKTRKVPQTPDELHAQEMNDWNGGIK